jgi:hypothetical protein
MLHADDSWNSSIWRKQAECSATIPKLADNLPPQHHAQMNENIINRVNRETTVQTNLFEQTVRIINIAISSIMS